MAEHKLIIIEATGLEPSEPATIFVYLSQKQFNPNRNQGHGQWDRTRNRTGNWDGHVNRQIQVQNTGSNQFVNQSQAQQMISTQTPAGSTANASVAFSYPTTVSINGQTTNSNGLKTYQDPRSIQQMVNNQVNQALAQAGIRRPVPMPNIPNMPIPMPQMPPNMPMPLPQVPRPDIPYFKRQELQL